jgi:hypothetical protein
MKINISNHFSPEGKEYYRWELWEGPNDSSDYARGYAVDLITAFSKLIEWRERINADYAAEIAEDLETLKEFTTNNETDR